MVSFILSFLVVQCLTWRGGVGDVESSVADAVVRVEVYPGCRAGGLQRGRRCSAAVLPQRSVFREETVTDLEIHDRHAI